MREQAREEPQWFAYRTDVSLRGGPLARTWLARSVLLLFGIGACVAIYCAFVWLATLDAEPVVRGFGSLSHLFPS